MKSAKCFTNTQKKQILLQRKRFKKYIKELGFFSKYYLDFCYNFTYKWVIIKIINNKLIRIV